MTLKTRILLAFLSISFLALVLASYNFFRISTDSYKNELYSYLVTINFQKQLRVEQWIERETINLELLAKLSVFQAAFTDRATLTQRQLQNSTPDSIVERHLMPSLLSGIYQELFILNIPDGEVIISTSRSQEGKIMSKRPFYIQGQNRSYVSNPHYSLSIREPTMVISTPIRHKSSVVAVLAARLNLNYLTSIITERTDLKGTEDSFIVNDNHYFLTEPRYGNNYALKKTTYSDGVTAALAGQTGVKWYLDYRGVPVIGAYTYLDKQNIALLTEIDQQEYQAPIREIKNKLILVSLLVAAAAVAIGLFTAEMLYKPVRKLGDAVGQMSGENLLEFKNPLSGTDELAIFGDKLAALTNRLRSTLVSQDELLVEIERRTQLEKRLKKSLLETKRSNEELQQFAYVASHDLQEPLRMVSSFTQLLADRYKDQLDEKAHRYINFAVDGAARMQILIEDLLRFSRISTQGKELVPINSSAVLTDTLHLLRVLVNERNAQITHDNLPTIMGDEVQISQLFQNLITNGIKFCQAKTPTIHVSVQLNEDNFYQFSFRDNGIGIDQKYKDRVFVIFQRLHTREEYSGTGIGLSLCKRIVERHGGQIWFDTEPEGGTIFHITLQPAGDVENPDADNSDNSETRSIA
ncbi:MAG: sensor histidine kinase [Desulfobulbaceae bacterium]|nr:MAG: sensor histidine kinase [Desulfobulbaceae bacterium]